MLPETRAGDAKLLWKNIETLPAIVENVS